MRRFRLLSLTMLLGAAGGPAWAGAELRLSFTNDVLPILSKAGCNSGACHGKSGGQNGFHLTVFGYDPEADHRALVSDSWGRRTRRYDPDRSLLLLKPSMQVPHGGGLRLKEGSPQYETVRAWIALGAEFAPPGTPRLLGIGVTPGERQLRPGASQQLRVTARYGDATSRDVTSLANFASNAGHVASVNDAGLVRAAGAPGEAAVMVRYMGAVGVSRVLVPRSGVRPRASAYSWLKQGSRIDRLVAARLERLGIAPSAPADDAAFLRRVSLDLTGTLPAPEQAREFLGSGAGFSLRRERLVDRLLARPEYAANWALRWADVLRANRDVLGPKGAFVFHRWLREQMAANTPYDHWVRELLLAQGSTAEAGPANLYRAARTPDDAANTVSQVFLGVRLQCAQCHHHPFEKWGEQDFWGLAAFFAGLKRQALPDGAERIYPGALEPVHHPRTGAVMPARLLETVAPDADPKTQDLKPKTQTAELDPRAPLADWVTSPRNRFFARMLANRVWGLLFGRGIVEPVDDLRDTNPPSNPALLEALTATVLRTGFDQKALIREIVLSRTYQLSSTPNPTNARDDQAFSRARARRMPAEVLLDAICSATGVPEKFEGAPEGIRALDLWDNRLPSYFLVVFGRPARAGPCECERSQEPSITQALHLMNSPAIQEKIAGHRGRVAQLVRAVAPPERIVEELYLATVTRFPTSAERRTGLALLRRASDRQAAAEDLLWALMNSLEFLFNR